MLASTRYIWWRSTQTLSFGSPLEFILGIGLYMAELYAWVVLALGFLQTIWPLHRPAIALRGPLATLPIVDVYVPTYNESLDIVRTTVFAAMAMDYPHDRFRVFILDDGRRPEFRDFARSAGCGYLTRSDNLHAKAGNLNAALKRTDGELICVFDCDHVPTRAFLQMTVGWFQEDPKLAVLQTPHHFYSPDPVQRNVAAVEDMPGEGELFYGAVQSGNDLWNATFFCGSCAIIRRRALEQTNGFAGETVTEDAHTALKLQRRGWNTAYINIRLSAGLATERLILHIGQRVRWARGMTQIFRIDNPLSGPGLSVPQRLCYLNAMLHFQFPLPRIVFLTSPLAYLLAGQSVIHASAAMIFAYAVPHLFASMKSSERLQGSERRPFWGEIYETLLAFHLVKPTILTLINPRKGKFNVTDKGATLDKGFFDYQTLRPHLIAAGLLVLGIIAGFAKLLFPDTFDVQIGTLLLNTAWTMFSLLILVSAISVGRETRQTRDTVRFAASLPVTLYFEDGHVVDAQTSNVSMGGLAIRTPERFDLNGRVVTDVAVNVRDQSFILPVNTVVAAGGLARISFSTLSIVEERRLAEALMGRADAWQHTAIHKAEKSIESIMDIARVSASTLIAGSGSIRRPRQLVRAAASAMTIMFGIAALLAVLGGVANARTPTVPTKRATTSAPPSNSRTMRLTLKDLRVQDRIRLAGTQGEIGIPFGMARDDVVTDAKLILNLAYSPALLPDISHVVVLLNGEVVRSVPLPRETANGLQIAIPIEPALFLAGDNQINLRLVGHYARDCEDPLNSALWANISNTRSFLELSVQKLPQRRDLSSLPAPFFDQYQPQPLTLPFVFAGSPSGNELEAAASVAGWLGSAASYRGYAFKPMTGIPPTGNAILFVTPGRTVAGIVPPAINGPALAIIANPRDSYGSLLLVMGRDGRELKLAAAVLATSTGTLGGQFASVDGARPPVTDRYQAPRWLRTDRPVQLGEIVRPLTLQGQGLPPGPLTAAFRLAPDLFFWPRTGARLDLGYTYPSAPWLDRQRSRLDLSLNGQYLHTFRLTDGLWARLMGASDSVSHHATGNAVLPSYALYGQNEISLFYDLQVADKRHCTGTLPTNVKVGIDPTSTIDLRGVHHAAPMPDLALLAGAGFPFTRTPDLGETVALLPPNPTSSEIEAFLALMGRLGDATGAAPTRLTVLQSVDADQMEGKDILVVGRAALAGSAALFSGAPIHWDGTRMQLAARSRIRKAWDFVGPAPMLGTPPVDQSLLATDSFAGIAGFRSPFDPDHSVVAFVATHPDDLPDLVYSLSDRTINASVQGDLALLTGDRMRSFRVGSTYWSGSLPWWLKTAYWLSQHPLLLALAAVLAAILASIPAYALLKAQQQRRLVRIEE
jgi:cellulose synthase (UDP-forming)